MTTAPPLVSCLCLTHHRLPMLQRALRYFRSQQWPNKELVVVHDEDDRAAAAFVAALGDPQVRAVAIPALPATTLGAKRNIGVAACRGRYLAVWDDDDYSGPGRITAQMRAVAESGLPACTLAQIGVYDTRLQQAWLSETRPWEQTLLAEIAHMPPYADLAIGEDVPCVDSLRRAGRLAAVLHPELYIYTAHGHNTSRRGHFRHHIYAHAQALPPAMAQRMAALLDGSDPRPLAAGELSHGLPRQG